MSASDVLAGRELCREESVDDCDRKEQMGL
jgi:hypothetical protein